MTIRWGWGFLGLIVACYVQASFPEGCLKALEILEKSDVGVQEKLTIESAVERLLSNNPPYNCRQYIVKDVNKGFFERWKKALCDKAPSDPKIMDAYVAFLKVYSSKTSFQEHVENFLYFLRYNKTDVLKKALDVKNGFLGIISRGQGENLKEIKELIESAELIIDADIKGPILQDKVTSLLKGEITCQELLDSLNIKSPH